jgi:flavin-dependent dehydrogenase
MDAEVLVIGGGPAGLAAAIAAAQSGFSVELAEPLQGAIDKCCGEGLLPPAVLALGHLGISPRLLADAGAPLRGIRFHHGNRQSNARFSAKAPAFGVRRTMLHAMLRERALAVGVRITTDSARLLVDGQHVQVRLADQLRSPQWIIGADGAQSSVRAAAGLNEELIVSRRFAVRQHRQLTKNTVDPTEVEIYWALGAQAYLTVSEPGKVGIAVVSRRRLPSMAAALALFPDLQQRLAGATECSASRGAVTTHRVLRRVHTGSIALVGDASGSVDAITGDGLSLAFQQAPALAKALRCGDLRSYGQSHARLLRPARAMSRALLAMGSSPLVTRASMLLLASIPGLFQSLLRLHTDPSTFLPALQEPAPWQAAVTSTRSAT